MQRNKTGMLPVRTFLFVAILLGSFIFSCQVEEKRPNIIFILSDDQGYGDFSCYGNEILKTPNMDKLHEQSTRFTNFFVSPVCAPTRASLMTGRYNYRTGVWDTWKGRVNMHNDEVTVAEVLRDAGYHTALFGKWHLGFNVPVRPQDQGFELAFEMEEFIKQSRTRFDPIMKRNYEMEQHEGFIDDIIFDEAIDWIEQQSKKDQPFFAYVSSFMPHTSDLPQVPESYVKRFDQYDNMIQHQKEVYAMLTKLDENVGRLLQRVDELGLNENTIVLYASDNGPHVGGPREEGAVERHNCGLRGVKTQVYEGGIKVPLFIRWPGKIEAGKDIEHMAAHIDIMPTLLDICDIPLPQGVKIDGKSLLPLINDRNADWPDRAIFGQFQRAAVPELWPRGFMRTEQYKLINGKELYDIQQDPGEQNDISDQNPQIVKEMRASFEAWFNDVSSDRGFETSYIILGSEAQRQITLQFWDRNAKGWPMLIESEGPYRFTVENVNPDLFPKGADIIISCGSVSAKQPISKDQSEMVFEGILLDKGLFHFDIRTQGYKLPKEGRWGLEDLGYLNIVIEPMSTN